MEKEIIRFFKKFAWLFAGVTTRSLGDMSPSRYNGKNLEKFLKLYEFLFRDCCVVNAHPEYKGTIKVVTEEIRSDIWGDALVTKVPGKVLTIMADDYPSVFLFEPLNDVAGIIRAELRSIMTGIIPAVIDTMVELGAMREMILAAVGPAMSQDGFEYPSNQLFRLKEYNRPEIVRTVREKNKSRAWIDQKALVKAHMTDAGISHVSVCNEYTDKNPKDFFSVRRREHQKELAFIGMVS